jgi:hypothetical protein
MEDDLNVFENGRRPQFFLNGRRLQFIFEKEDNLFNLEDDLNSY